MSANKTENKGTDFEEKLHAVFAKHFGGFRKLLSCNRLSGGASQETYHIIIETDTGKQTFAMRRSIGKMADSSLLGLPGLFVEAELFRQARIAGIPEPEIFYVTESEDGLGEAFIMEWLDGETLGTRIVRSEEYEKVRPQLAYECGQIIARIHSIDLKETGLDKVLNTVDPKTLVKLSYDKYVAYNTPQPMIDYSARWLKENLPDNTQKALVHNDFRNGNIMFSPKGVVAVLDWELAHIGDPMRDLGWICTNSWRFGRTDLPVGGFGSYEDLFRGYEDVSGNKVDPDHVKFWEVFGSFWWALGCLTMMELFRNGPDKTVERPAVARRTSECQVDCVNLLFPGPVDLVKGEEGGTSSEMPTIDELVMSVRDFLRSDVMDSTKGRTNFMARVAGNSLDIVLRDLRVGEKHRELELKRLQELFSTTGDLETLRWHLVNKLRDGSIPLDYPGLKEHLRTTVVNQIAIDQPKYSGFKVALKNMSI